MFICGYCEKHKPMEGQHAVVFDDESEGFVCANCWQAAEIESGIWDDENHLGCEAYPNCDEDPVRCRVLHPNGY